MCVKDPFSQIRSPIRVTFLLEYFDLFDNVTSRSLYLGPLARWDPGQVAPPPPVPKPYSQLHPRLKLLSVFSHFRLTILKGGARLIFKTKTMEPSSQQTCMHGWNNENDYMHTAHTSIGSDCV